MISFKHFVLLLSSLSFTICGATNVRSCDDGTPPPLSTEINDCREMPCDIIAGKSVLMDIVFQNYEYTETTRPRAIAYALGTSAEFVLEQKNGCDTFTNIQCPISPRDIVKYHFELPLSAIYPKIAFELTVSLLNDNNNTIFCFVADMQVVR